MGDLPYQNFSRICAEEVLRTTKDVLADPWDYIACYRGPQAFEERNIAIVLTVIYVVIFITGLLGNIAVCIVIVKQPQLHTATNYYLFNLAISDITLLVSGIPNEITYYWYQYPWVLGEALCKTRALVSEMSSYVSVLTIVAFSTERYIGICYPLHRGAVAPLHRVIAVIGCLWLIAFICAIPFALSTFIDYVRYPPDSGEIIIWESGFCAMVDQPKNIPLTEISVSVFFVLPFFILTIQYTSMGIAITRASKSTLKGGQVRGSVHRKTQANKNIIRMLFFIVLAFFLCWAPFHLQRVLCIYMDDDDLSTDIKSWAYIITGVFYYFSSTANPILYNIMSDRMRSGFKEIFCGIRQQRLSQKSIISRNTGSIQCAPVSMRNSVFTGASEDVFVAPQDMLLYREKFGTSNNMEDKDSSQNNHTNCFQNRYGGKGETCV